MTLVVVLAIIAAIGVGIWLLDKVIDGLADAALAVVALPFRGLWRQAQRNHRAHSLTSTQSFRSALPPDDASLIIATLPGVAETAAPGPTMPHYRSREPERVVIAVGNDTKTLYEAAIAVRPGEASDTVGEVTVLSWSGPPESALAAHHDLLDTVFPALHAANTQLAVVSSAVGTPSGPAARLVTPPAGAWPDHRRPTSSTARHLPALPTAAITVFSLAVIAALAAGAGLLHTTTRDELCSSYRSAASVVNDDTTIDVTDEIRDLADNAKGFGDGDVRDDGDKLGDLAGMFSASEFDRATTHIAGVCS